MGIFEAIVVFVCSWWLIFLPILSAGTRSQHETGEVIPGTERSAPVSISWRRKLTIATAGAVACTFLVWLTLHMHWLDFMIPKT
jgi:predicted secreted protein